MTKHFDGINLQKSDHERLTSQFDVIFNLMSDSKPRKLHEIEIITGSHKQA